MHTQKVDCYFEFRVLVLLSAAFGFFAVYPFFAELHKNTLNPNNEQTKPFFDSRRVKRDIPTFTF